MAPLEAVGYLPRVLTSWSNYLRRIAFINRSSIHTNVHEYRDL